MNGYVISAALHARLLAAAAAAPHAEICGLLYGDPPGAGDGAGGAPRILAAEAARNVAADPATGFEIDPATLIAAHRAARTGRADGLAWIGHYHSHPNGRADPSPRDRAAAAPGSLWLIVGGGQARLWHVLQEETRLWPGRHGNFIEVNLIFAGLAPK